MSPAFDVRLRPHGGEAGPESSLAAAGGGWRQRKGGKRRADPRGSIGILLDRGEDLRPRVRAGVGDIVVVRARDDETPERVLRPNARRFACASAICPAQQFQACESGWFTMRLAAFLR